MKTVKEFEIKVKYSFMNGYEVAAYRSTMWEVNEYKAEMEDYHKDKVVGWKVKEVEVPWEASEEYLNSEGIRS